MTNKILNLLAKVEAWYASKTCKFDVHYRVEYDVSNPSAIAIRILKRYPGVVVLISDVGVSDANILSFNFQIAHNEKKVNTNSRGFQRFIKYIVLSLIKKSIETTEPHTNAGESLNEDGSVDTEESDTERALHEKGSSVSEGRILHRKPRKKTIRGNKKVRPKVQ